MDGMEDIQEEEKEYLHRFELECWSPPSGITLYQVQRSARNSTYAARLRRDIGERDPLALRSLGLSGSFVMEATRLAIGDEPIIDDKRTARIVIDLTPVMGLWDLVRLALQEWGRSQRQPEAADAAACSLSVWPTGTTLFISVDRWKDQGAANLLSDFCRRDMKQAASCLSAGRVYRSVGAWLLENMADLRHTHCPYDSYDE
jgi:hypothetical protein